MSGEILFCHRCGTRLEERFLHGRLRPVCPACGLIVFMDPKVGAGVVIEDNGRVVLIRRAMEPKQGWWALPSGFVEHDETTEEAAIREAKEETGLIVEIDGLLGVYSFYSDPYGSESRGRGVLVLYAAHTVGGTLQAGDDAAEVALFTPQEIPPDIAFETHQKALADWRRARAIIYRPATPEELPLVDQLRRQHRHELIPKGLMQGQDLVLVAEDKGRLVAFATVALQHDRGIAYLNQIFVHPSYRRWGIGTHLINEVLHVAEQQRLHTVLSPVFAASPALVVYLKAHFRVSGFLDADPNSTGQMPDTILFLSRALTHQ